VIKTSNPILLCLLLFETFSLIAKRTDADRSQQQIVDAADLYTRYEA